MRDLSHLDKYVVACDPGGKAFCLPFRIGRGRKKSTYLNVIASWIDGWDHVSVTVSGGTPRCPTWEEMCFVKDETLGEKVWAMQLHPPKAENISIHNYCLHMWRPHDESIPLPPTYKINGKKVI